MHELQTVALRTAHKLPPPGRPSITKRRGKHGLLTCFLSNACKLTQGSSLLLLQLALCCSSSAKISVTHSTRLVLLHFTLKYSSTKRNVPGFCVLGWKSLTFLAVKPLTRSNKDEGLINYAALNLEERDVDLKAGLRCQSEQNAGLSILIGSSTKKAGFTKVQNHSYGPQLLL